MTWADIDVTGTSRRASRAPGSGEWVFLSIGLPLHHHALSPTQKKSGGGKKGHRRRSLSEKFIPSTMVEELSGLTRVTSSLELLSHTATLKSEIEAKEEQERLQEAAGRVSPASTTSEHGGLRATSALGSIFVSPRDTAVFGRGGGVAIDSGYSIEGYASTDDARDDDAEELSPIPSQPAENLSAYLARGGGTALPLALGAHDSGHFLLKFHGSSGSRAVTETLGRRESGFLHHGDGLLCASFSSASDLQVPLPPNHHGRLERENSDLRQLVEAKDRTIASLEASLASLEKQVADLRQLPTGKISQIPLEYVSRGSCSPHVTSPPQKTHALLFCFVFHPFVFLLLDRDMLQLMRDYGSELSDTAVPPRKDAVQKASVVRQFRRWNPTFFEHFVHKNGKWVPKLGKKGELDRRAKVRGDVARKTAAASTTSSKGDSSTTGGAPAAVRSSKK